MDILQQMGIQRWHLRSDRAASTAGTRASLPGNDNGAHSAEQHKPVLPSSRPPDATLNLTGSQVDADLKVAEGGADTNFEKSARQSARPVTGNRLDDLGWQDLADLLDSGSLCESCGKQNSVFGEGDPAAQWVFVIESPTPRDVQNHQLLSGRTGQLFDAILQSVGLTRAQIYLSSARKCPAAAGSNAKPLCSNVIYRQLELIKPKVVLTLGEFAARAVLRSNDGLNALRSNGELQTSSGIPVIVTYAADEMLDHPDLKAQVWWDLKKCLRLLPALEH